MNELLQQTNSSTKIKKWWKKYNSNDLINVYKITKSSLPDSDLQELANKCKSITNVCKGDGAGLSGGILTDMLLCNYLSEKLKDHFEELHSGESDIKIDNTELSLKKINGKSIIALDCGVKMKQTIKKIILIVMLL